MKALIASESGHLYSWDSDRSAKLDSVFLASDYLMGLARKKDTLYVGSRHHIYTFKGKVEKVIGRWHQSYHHLDVVGNSLYITATKRNEVHRYDLDKINREYETYIISPPDPSRPIKAKEDGGRNYNHINKVFYHNGKFYVNLNWLTKQYGPSGVAVCDRDFNELERFEYGWQSHGFCYVGDWAYALCATTGNKHDHPDRAGLMVEHDLVYEHDPKKWFCKDFSANDDILIMAGGQINERNRRKHSDGILYILDRSFNKVDELRFANSGGFKGVLLEDLDYTKSYG